MFLNNENLKEKIAKGKLGDVIENLIYQMSFAIDNKTANVDLIHIHELRDKLINLSGQLNSIDRELFTKETEFSIKARIRLSTLDVINELPYSFWRKKDPVPEPEPHPQPTSIIEQTETKNIGVEMDESVGNCENCLEEEDDLCDVSVKRRLRLQCTYYVRRNVFNESLKRLRTDGFLQIMGPHGYGKHSLMIRLDNYAKLTNHDTLFLDFFKFNTKTSDVNYFIKHLCQFIYEKLPSNKHNENLVEKIWAGFGSVDYKFDEFIEQFLIKKRTNKVFLFIRGLASLEDKFSVILFNSLLRWTEKRKSNESWQALCVAVAYSPDFWYKIEKKYKDGVIISNEGSFDLEPIKYRNKPVILSGFSTTELFELANDRYRLNNADWQPEKILSVARFVGYNPSLLNFAFLSIKDENLSPNNFKKKACRKNGLYNEYFKKLREEIEPESVKHQLKRVVKNKKIDDDKYVHLWSLGIVSKEEKKYSVADLYKVHLLQKVDLSEFSLLALPLVIFTVWILTCVGIYLVMNYSFKSLQPGVFALFAVSSFVAMILLSFRNTSKFIKQYFQN